VNPDEDAARSPLAADHRAAVLDRPAPSPELLLRSFVLRPRTQNVLRRFLAARPSSGPWTYRRLIEIDGFGSSALADVLQSQRRGRRRVIGPQLGSRPPGARAPLGDAQLGRVIAIVSRKLPATEAQLRARLEAAGFGDPPPLAAIERAGRFQRRPIPFVVLRREGFALAVAPDRLGLAQIIHKLSVRATSASSIGDLRTIAFQAGTGELAFVRQVVAARDGVRWLDRQRRFFAAGRAPRA
jgi:hypothetical protein